MKNEKSINILLLGSWLKREKLIIFKSIKITYKDYIAMQLKIIEKEVLQSSHNYGRRKRGQQSLYTGISVTGPTLDPFNSF